MADGFIYVLKNPHMPRLVKIGYTERSPHARAIELSHHTGVPGNFSVVKSWFIQDAATYEKRIFSELRADRKAGEHFQLSPVQAVERINILLRAWGQIGEDGLTQTERAKAAQRQREWDEAEKATKYRAYINQIEWEIKQSEISAENAASDACAPLRKTHSIKCVIIWAVLCMVGIIFLDDWGYEHAANAALFIGLLGAPFAWLSGPTSTPEYEKIKKSLCETARQRILAKHGLPPTWTTSDLKS